MERVAEIPELMAAGDRAYLTNDLEVAAEKFSLATELSVAAYGDFAPECFEPYFKYGRALAGIAQLENEDPEHEFKNIQNYLAKMAEGKTSDLMDDSTPGTEATDAPKEEDDMEEGEDSEEEEDLPTSQVAFENLEVARKIAEKQGESKEWQLKLAETFSMIGQLYLERDMHAEAITDLQTALELNQKNLDANDRIIASSYFELALAHNLNNDFLRASELAAKSKEILTFCVQAAKDDVAELEECLKDVSAAYDDYVASHKDAELKKAEEAKEAAKDPEKNENQEPVADITSNIRKGKRPAEEIQDNTAKKVKIDEVAEPADVSLDPVAESSKNL